MKIEVHYLFSIGLLITGLVLFFNPYVEYTLLICVTDGYGHTTCYNKVVRSFKFPILFSGVLSIINSSIYILIITLIIIKRRLNKR